MSRAGMLKGWAEIYKYRSLLVNLISADQKLRYKNTLVGFLWSFLNPLLLMAVFYVVFGVIGQFSKSVAHYPLFLLTGLLPWQFFSSALLSASVSFRNSSGLLTRVAFPRQVIPLACVSTHLINFLYSLVLLLGFYVMAGVPLKISIVYLPLIILLQFVMLAWAGYALAVLCAFYQDAHYLLGVVLSMAFYLTPVFYPVALVPERYRPLLGLNPMTHFVNAYHRTLLYGVPPGPRTLSFLVVFTSSVYWFGWKMFRKYQSRVPEIL